MGLSWVYLCFPFLTDIPFPFYSLPLILIHSLFLFVFHNTARKPLKSYNATFMGSVGALAGVFVGISRSSQRLMGFMENNSEIVEYGLCPPEELANHQRRMKIFNLAMIEAEKIPEKKND